MLALAREHGTAVVTAPLDSYVTSRMITLSAPSHALMDREPLTVRPDDLVSDIADDIKDIHYRAAVAVDERGRPVGLVTRSDLVNPRPRRVLLVDHAEQAQSVPGVEQAEIVEILDHHHIGSIETHVPVRATFDPVGSTATLVIERFRQNGMEPSRPSAMMLAGAILSDTVILNSPTTTARDHSAIEYLERALAFDAAAFGREMFEQTSDTSRTAAEDIVSGDAKQYGVSSGQTVCIAQIETVGDSVLERREELLAALDSARERGGHALYVLMVTDILTKGTKLLVSGNPAPLERAFECEVRNGELDLPGVMSRKKQVAPKLLAAFLNPARKRRAAHTTPPHHRPLLAPHEQLQRATAARHPPLRGTCRTRTGRPPRSRRSRPLPAARACRDGPGCRRRSRRRRGRRRAPPARRRPRGGSPGRRSWPRCPA